MDDRFPHRSLPLELVDARPGGIEGQPGDVGTWRLLAQVGSYNIDVLIFFGSNEPNQRTLDAARDELERLVVPGPPGGESLRTLEERSSRHLRDGGPRVTGSAEAATQG